MFLVAAMVNQARDQTRYFIGLPSHGSRKGVYDDEDAGLEKVRKEIEANQESALSLCTEKVLLARQAYDLVSYISRATPAATALSMDTIK